MKTIPIQTVEQNWKAFRASLPPHLPPAEATRLKLIYYAAFATALDTTVAIADLPEDEAVAKLQGLHDECLAFGKSVQTYYRR